MVGGEGGAEGAAGVSRRRLDPDAGEAPVAQDLAVCDTVQRHPAREAQIACAGLHGDAGGQPEYHLVEHRLDRGGQIHVPLRQ